MSIRLSCPRGHQCELSEDFYIRQSIDSIVCPICGASAVVLTLSTTQGSGSAGVPAVHQAPSPTAVGADLPFPVSDGAATLSDAPVPDLAATQPPGKPSSGPSISASQVPPGYEILELLGQGSMGVVFKARHLRLNRVVALKMVLAGAHAAEADLARSRTEAEVIARLQHPGIVQIHGIGEHQGQRFVSLEFCPGGSLDRLLNGSPQPPLRAAALVEKLARAMHAAHQARVVHRDLKPANVLLAADGTPKITDFGLARKLDEPGQTQTGVILGTPSYMPPEQAQGKEVGPAADIYALGAILYDCLTGRPPFRAATELDTILQVVANEPLPPRQLNRQVPADLQTICLACLAKEPARRYRSAELLAEDLRRYREGEPILARPIGWRERGWKWMRRNPALAGALATLVVVLLLGGVVSLDFALDASRQAKDALRSEGEALRSAEKIRQNVATIHNNEEKIIEARDDVERQTNQLETTLVLSMLGPLGSGVSTQEIEAFWELASHQGSRLGVRFVEEASRGTINCRQLRLRAETALHSAVGLSLKKRAEVEKLLRQRLESGRLGEAEATDLVLTLAVLGGFSAETDLTIARTLNQAMSRTTDSITLERLAKGLAAVCTRLEPREASRCCAEAVALLSQTLSKTSDFDACRRLAEGLATVVARLEPREAATFLTQAMSKTTNSYAHRSLAQGLAAVAARLEPKEAVALLSQAMSWTTNSYAHRSLAQGLAAVAARLEPKEAAALLSQAMSWTKDFLALESLAKGLAAVALRLEPREAATLLSQAMSKTFDSRALQELAEGLTAVAARLEPREASRYCAEAAALLSQVMSRTTDSYALESLAKGLATLAARLEPREAYRYCAAAATLLSQCMSITTDSSDLGNLAEGLAAVALRLEPREAAALLNQTMSGTTDSSALWRLAEGLAAVAARLEPKEATPLLSQAMSRTTDSSALWRLAEGLAAVALRLEPREAATLLSQAMSKTFDSRALQELAEGLTAVAARLEPREASHNCAEAAALLSQAISKTTDSSALWSLAGGLAIVAARLEPREATRYRAEAAAQLSQAMSRTTDSIDLGFRAQGLAAVAARLEPKEAAALLSQAMSWTSNSTALWCLVEGLDAVAARLEPKEAAALLSQAISRTTDPVAHGRLAKGLDAVAVRLEPREASRYRAEAAALIIQALSRISDPYRLRFLAEDLAAVAARLESREASRCRAEAATLLSQAMSPTSSSNELRSLTEGLAAVTVGLEPRELSRRQQSLVGSIGLVANPNLLAFCPALPALEQVPPSLPVQSLVDLLKQPFCIGQARRIVLDQLQRHYGRPFADQWDFAHFAGEQKLDLDLTSPPRWPDFLAKQVKP